MSRPVPPPPPACRGDSLESLGEATLQLNKDMIDALDVDFEDREGVDMSPAVASAQQGIWGNALGTIGALGHSVLGTTFTYIPPAVNAAFASVSPSPTLPGPLPLPTPVPIPAPSISQAGCTLLSHDYSFDRTQSSRQTSSVFSSATSADEMLAGGGAVGPGGQPDCNGSTGVPPRDISISAKGWVDAGAAGSETTTPFLAAPAAALVFEPGMNGLADYEARGVHGSASAPWLQQQAQGSCAAGTEGSEASGATASAAVAAAGWGAAGSASANGRLAAPAAVPRYGFVDLGGASWGVDNPLMAATAAAGLGGAGPGQGQASLFPSLAEFGSLLGLADPKAACNWPQPSSSALLQPALGMPPAPAEEGGGGLASPDGAPPSNASADSQPVGGLGAGLLNSTAAQASLQAQALQAARVRAMTLSPSPGAGQGLGQGQGASMLLVPKATLMARHGGLVMSMGQAAQQQQQQQSNPGSRAGNSFWMPPSLTGAHTYAPSSALTFANSHVMMAGGADGLGRTHTLSGHQSSVLSQLGGGGADGDGLQLGHGVGTLEGGALTLQAPSSSMQLLVQAGVGGGGGGGASSLLDLGGAGVGQGQGQGVCTPRSRPCRYYLQGYCRDADRCRFSHPSLGQQMLQQGGAGAGAAHTLMLQQQQQQPAGAGGGYNVRQPALAGGMGMGLGGFAFGAPGSDAFSRPEGLPAALPHQLGSGRNSLQLPCPIQQLGRGHPNGSLAQQCNAVPALPEDLTFSPSSSPHTDSSMATAAHLLLR